MYCFNIYTYKLFTYKLFSYVSKMDIVMNTQLIRNQIEMTIESK